MDAEKKHGAGHPKELITRLPIQVRSLLNCMLTAFAICYGVSKAFEIFLGGGNLTFKLTDVSINFLLFAFPVVTLLLYFLYDLFIRRDQKSRDSDDCLDRSVYVIRGERRLFNELFKSPESVVKTAKKMLCVTGSRSRDESYLKAIESHVSTTDDLIYTRVLFGEPRTPEMKKHVEALRLLFEKLGKAQGTGRIRVSELPIDGEISERFIVASETRALLAIPSFTSPQGYDTALIIEDDSVSKQLCSIISAMAENAPLKHIWGNGR